MNTTTELKSPGQIKSLSDNLIDYIANTKAEALTDENIGNLGPAFQQIILQHFKAVIASLPRARVRVLTAEDILKALKIPLGRSELTVHVSMEGMQRMADELNALLSFTPPTEPIKPEQESGEGETPDHCPVCLHKKTCGCLGIWPYTYSTYPGEHKMVKCHPSNAEEMFYKRAEVDDLVATFERSRDALRLQLANAMVERDQMNAKRDAEREVEASIPTVRLLDEHIQVMYAKNWASKEETITVGSAARILDQRDAALERVKELENTLSIYGAECKKTDDKLTASQAELAKTKIIISETELGWKTYQHGQDTIVESLTAKLKAAEEEKSKLIASYNDTNDKIEWASQQVDLIIAQRDDAAKERDELRATISRQEEIISKIKQLLA